MKNFILNGEQSNSGSLKLGQEITVVWDIRSSAFVSSAYFLLTDL